MELIGELKPEEQLPDEYRFFANSELKTFKQCRRRWWLSYYRKVSRKKERIEGPAALGTRVHSSLETWYVPEDIPAIHPLDKIDMDAEADRALADELDWYSEKELSQLEKDIKLARVMVDGYLDWVEETGADVGLRVIAPEARVIADPLIPDRPEARLLAKLDVRTENERDGSRNFMDHKTAPSLEHIIKTSKLDEQILHYELIELLNLVAAGGSKDRRTDGAIFNILRKVGRGATAKPPFYGRHLVRHNLTTLRNYFNRVKATIRDITIVEQQLDNGGNHQEIVYPNPTKDCNWMCSYYNICHMFDDGSYVEEMIEEQFITINPLKRYETEGTEEV